MGRDHGRHHQGEGAGVHQQQTQRRVGRAAAQTQRGAQQGERVARLERPEHREQRLAGGRAVASDHHVADHEEFEAPEVRRAHRAVRDELPRRFPNRGEAALAGDAAARDRVGKRLPLLEHLPRRARVVADPEVVGPLVLHQDGRPVAELVAGDPGCDHQRRDAAEDEHESQRLARAEAPPPLGRQQQREDPERGLQQQRQSGDAAERGDGCAAAPLETVHAVEYDADQQQEEGLRPEQVRVGDESRVEQQEAGRESREARAADAGGGPVHGDRRERTRERLHETRREAGAETDRRRRLHRCPRAGTK